MYTIKKSQIFVFIFGYNDDAQLQDLFTDYTLINLSQNQPGISVGRG